MTKTIEDIPTMSAVQDLIRLLRGEDIAAWVKADAMKRAVEDDWEHRPEGDAAKANTGLFARVDEVWQVVAEDEEIAEKPDHTTMARWYNVASAWPDETRVTGASYRAHQALAGREWTNRQGILSKIVGRKRQGIVNEMDVIRWKQEQEGRDPMVPWEERFYKRLDSVVHSRTFGISTPEEMRTAIKLVNTLVGDLQNELEEMENA